ncbi:LysR family transcriptional regulator [Streptomyces sp. NA04227]|uniref:LysR family transcriptional regulator n=1 Tax=Streptomyces sp. NA04227 TaxID=2742136 RepID=UPI001591886A|nr:LysR family transcriptional regulator [Streptomyces sp. NA04227]QKW05156.1 LysR family transcriptional regulator [Streptomyces sp. NA04227]
MLDVRRMQILRAVVTSGSVTAAASNLGYTPSAVSQQVAALEKEAGIALLERVGRGVRPTEAGRLLTRHAAVIGRNLAEAEAELADLRDGHAGRLTVRYFPSVGPTLVAPALARFREQHQGVHIDLALYDPLGPQAGAEQDTADLTLVIGADGTHAPSVRLLHLLDDPYYAVLPAGHRLAAQRELDLAELADEPWVGSEAPGPCLQPVVDACAAAGFTPHFVAASEDYATTQGFVAAGLGVGLIPRLGLTNPHPDVVISRVRHPEPVRAIHAAVRQVGLPQPALRALIEALKEAARR